MGFITEICTEEKVDITFYSKTLSVINGIIQPEAYSEVKTVKGLMWFGGQGVAFISDKMKTQVDGVISIDYDSTIEALKDNSRIVVDSINYQIIHIENVGKQNEVLQIGFSKEVSN